MCPASVLDLPIQERPRERLARAGPEALSDQELLAALLAPGVRGADGAELAARLLQRHGDLHRLAEATPAQLARVSGVGIVRATRLCAAFALGRRVCGERYIEGKPIRSAADVYEWARPRFGARRQEVFVALALDTKHRVSQVVEVAVGSLSGVEVHPRELFRPLIREAAAATLVLHNHPSGDPTPSTADIALSARLRDAGAIVGIPLLDHVVIAAGGYVSLAERGLI